MKITEEDLKHNCRTCIVGCIGAELIDRLEEMHKDSLARCRYIRLKGYDIIYRETL